jgi:aspartyl aminopeptidase
MGIKMKITMKPKFVKIASVAVIVAGLMVGGTVNAADEEKVKGNCKENIKFCKSAWVTLSAADKKIVFKFSEDYKNFMRTALTELTFVRDAVIIAKNRGFKELKDNSPMTLGARYYDVNRERALTLIVIGEDGFEKGFKVVGTHIDSPRLELKGKPFYDKEGFALFQTNYHGGIKPHQWTNIPLALMGRVNKKDGTVVEINVGLKPNDPIFIIAETSPHTDRGYKSKKVSDHVKYEMLDPVVGHIPDLKTGENVSGQVIKYLKAQYNITPNDLVSAELALVPAMPPRDVGFDRGLMAIYGQDDRLASYAALRAISDLKTPKTTAVAYLVDNEEVGNGNNTGAKSSYFSSLLSRLIYAKEGKRYREPMLRTALRNSKMISIDVNPGINPMSPESWEKQNAPRLGFGVNLKLYGRGFNANSEFIAEIRDTLDKENIPWQTSTYKVGKAGGGTIGGLFAIQNMDVIDFGVPLLSIHTPYAVSSKIDVYNLYRASKAFFRRK